MPQQSHPALRSEPDFSVSSATPVPVAPELRLADRLTGGLVVNRWTYRLLRFAGGLMSPRFDKTGVTIAKAPEIARGALIVTPDAATGSGAVFLIHGGGLVVGSNDQVLANAADLARRLGVPVICPSYRLAPEAPAPAAIDDVHAAWHGLRGRAGALGIDPAKIVIGGVSAGGGLAAVLAQRLHDEGGIQPAAQLLIYPMLDDRTAARRDLDRPRHRVWSNRNNLFGWSSYLGHPPGKNAPAYAVAARRNDLTGLPPTWLGVGTCDLFLDEGRAYARRLSDAGVDVTYVEVDGAIHGFDLANTDMGKAFGVSQATFIRQFTN